MAELRLDQRAGAEVSHAQQPRRGDAGCPARPEHHAIRKVFSDPFDLRAGKITRAELIGKKRGKVLLDMTADDIGTGADREGEIKWPPDSKRFASLSTWMNLQQRNLFSEPRQVPHLKQTAVYQLAGDAWSRIEIPLDKVPGRERDTEPDRAMLGHDYIEPIRWQKKKPIENSTFEQIGTLSRWYSITATISPEGKATLVWKLKKDR